MCTQLNFLIHLIRDINLDGQAANLQFLNVCIGGFQVAGDRRKQTILKHEV